MIQLLLVLQDIKHVVESKISDKTEVPDKSKTPDKLEKFLAGGDIILGCLISDEGMNDIFECHNQQINEFEVEGAIRMELQDRIFTHFPIQPQRIYSGEKGINVIVYPPTETVPEDLESVTWTQGFKVDFPIVVDTSQQPFSSWTFPQIKTLFELTADSYIDLPRFDGELADIANYEKILEDIAMKHKTCIHVTSANKATRRVLHGVATCYDGEVKIGDTIIVVTEAKIEDINQGVGQNAIQLQASSRRNKKKRTYNEALREDVMYGIVSTGVDWVIMKVCSTKVLCLKTQEFVWVNQVGI
ncbi:hypothetical protein C1646_775198 [Rhizophagus diaphanus]|nr:hypothetical protein C1646_775198 [Rhizophagus diaphanus] [Rhizophagus sp. MUCL 43196]